MAVAAISASAQGNNTRSGGADGDYQSLAERVLNLEKKTDAFQVYFNYAAAFQSGEMEGYDSPWTSQFKNKQLRLEIKGNIGEHLSYRLRHRLNKANDARGDNFAKATDIMMINWKFNDKWSIAGGKMCQIWGGFEFDENPMVIYQYSDMVDNMDNFMAGAMVSFKPVPSQEIAFMVSNANNDKFGGAKVLVGNKVEDFKTADNPLTYILNWNGSMFDGVLNTRWAYGIQTQADGKYSKMLTLGQQLNLPKFQWYIDYMGEWDDMDRLGIASGEVGDLLGNVQYNSFITKANWQFAPKWNLMLKGMFETANVKDIDGVNEKGEVIKNAYKNYRKSFGYIGALEYYPMEGQDFRVSLSYIGRKFNYSDDAKAVNSKLADYNTNRIELGFMYRIKAF